MSKYMHLTVTVSPYYQSYLEGTYPKLARRLKTLETDLMERNHSLYAIAGQLDKLLYTFDGTPLREVLIRHRENLRGRKQYPSGARFRVQGSDFLCASTMGTPDSRGAS